MNNSKKIPNDMRANLQQRAKDLRRNKDAAMIQEQKIPDNKEKEQEHNVPPKMEEIKKVQNKSDQQVEEWDSLQKMLYGRRLLTMLPKIMLLKTTCHWQREPL